MKMIYRSPAEMIEETREQMKKKPWLRNWIKEHYAQIVIIVVIAVMFSACVFAGISGKRAEREHRAAQLEQEAKDQAWANKLKQDRLTGDCSIFGHEKMTDIPARCIPYFQIKQTK